MKNPTIFLVFLLSEDFIVLWKDSIVVRQDSIVLWEDSIVVWEDSIVVWEENCVRKIAVFHYEKYSCQVWEFVIHKNFSPGKKSEKIRKTL